MPKYQRAAILVEARLAVIRGEHDDARRLFALVGISYVHTIEAIPCSYRFS